MWPTTSPQNILIGKMCTDLQGDKKEEERLVFDQCSRDTSSVGTIVVRGDIHHAPTALIFAQATQREEKEEDKEVRFMGRRRVV